MLVKKNKVIQGEKKDKGSSGIDIEQENPRITLFVVKEEQSYMEQSYAPSKRQSVSHSSGKLMEKIEDLEYSGIMK
ncbi:hypothetical protein SteCoe_6872 [Stentor coeruleus]|uniref:Uncharacterized protein n=1 Tax=Stentor coeruleus TaxID=5963 RepID=A0A1R2CNV2_9CILI|nr:hypothetical protein SteCoe_6872 [Stentor coeruleus]